MLYKVHKFSILNTAMLLSHALLAVKCMWCDIQMKSHESICLSCVWCDVINSALNPPDYTLSLGLVSLDNRFTNTYVILSSTILLFYNPLISITQMQYKSLFTADLQH